MIVGSLAPWFPFWICHSLACWFSFFNRLVYTLCAIPCYFLVLLSVTFFPSCCWLRLCLISYLVWFWYLYFDLPFLFIRVNLILTSLNFLFSLVWIFILSWFNLFLLDYGSLLLFCTVAVCEILFLSSVFWQLSFVVDIPLPFLDLILIEIFYFSFKSWQFIAILVGTWNYFLG